jgi:fatty-acyl-CoA synthase
MTRGTSSSTATPSPARAWSRALAMTSSIARQPRRTLPGVIDEIARVRGDAPALLSRGDCVTFRALADRSARYARWAVDRGLAKGDVVGLLMPNCPEYMAVWLGITSVGGVVALLNTNLEGAALAHCINVAAPSHVIVDASLAARVVAVRGDCATAPALWIRTGPEDELEPVDGYGRSVFEKEAATGERSSVTIHDRALYIYTSGTTGWPKAAVVSHGRLMQWTHWFAALMDVEAGDRMYNCLPMYHSVGGVVAAGAALVGGASVLIAEKFSTCRFWRDVADWDCTLFQYIGELCRYLVNAPPHPRESDHRLRLCCGNGLAPGVWRAFAARFRIPRILEFYASTEGNVSLVNVEGEPGAIGRIPPFLAHRFPMALVKVDGCGAPVRNGKGRCVECAPGEIGEAIGPLQRDSSNAGTWFEGYTDAEASERKVLRGVRAPGDSWVRTGDLMRRDGRGFVFFVDRIGDTFRWKGENVSAAEVADAIGCCPGVAEAAVYGVAVSGIEGRAGMAAIVAGDGFDLRVLHAHLAASLPEYARPLFLRIVGALPQTGTLRHMTHALARDGFDPDRIADPLYVDDRSRQSYVPLDNLAYDRVHSGRFLEISSCASAVAL